MASTLRCDNDHFFDAGFETQLSLSCPMCDSRMIRHAYTTGGFLSIRDALEQQSRMPANLKNVLRRIMDDIRARQAQAAPNLQVDDEGVPFFEAHLFDIDIN